MSNLKVQGNASGTGTTTLQSGNTNSSTTFSLPIADGTNGQALVTNGSGVLSFANSIDVAPGAAGNLLTSNGTVWTSAAGGGGGGLKSIQVFQPSSETSGGDFNGTWTRPSGVTKIHVKLVGGGAGGSQSGRGGGAGGYAEKIIDVTSISSVNVTVGGRVLSNTNGNSTSFGSYLSATGGFTNHFSGNGSGGIGGIGSGGDINSRGGGGSSQHSNGGSAGAASYFGGGSFGQQTSNQGVYPGAYGSGGAGCNNGYDAGAGARGICIVYEY
jgi:hypothetical protein